MFAKLLKHEWKATAGLLGIMSLAALGVGVAAGFIIRYMNLATISETDDALRTALAGPLSMLMVFLVLALVVYGFGTQIILYNRFYRSRFTDEGYLTFTLPASSSRIYLSALANTLIWSAISILVLFLSVAAMVLIGSVISDGYSTDTDALEAYGELWATEGYAAYVILSLLRGLAGFFSGPVMVLTCITLGATLAKKHKILTALGLYYGLSMAISTLESAAEIATVLNSYSSTADIYGGATLLVLGIQIAIQAGIAVGGSFLSIWLMDNKLNLP